MWIGQRNAQLGWDRPEQLSKFIISRADHFESQLTVTGRSCSDARPLRFAEHQPWANDASLSIREIERLTTLRRVVDPVPSSVTSSAETVYGGYFIFIAPGKWLVEVKDSDRLVGSAVIEVIAAETKQ